ncbi:MAG: CBS domain-containing protein [Comamonadaceae bacterium]|jgi:CBS domain-containing protein|uniref:CBS domain-containing protein n=1 Tax=Hydrogenophaga borbori TaxID=2294117 RepID=A0A372EPG9_9BURK|nr:MULTISPECIES: CBS domain-containing protein [Hydrogenophaga]NCT95810.1 CBS domain-containing protein [Comamonadaceae bacterium]RFP82530.1 CBS domain-containing protein [Hydrogenophaga borbori]WQB82106.1 CBS domain-containing protein [Hydrogenophaga sp. SNF1]
MNQVSEVMTRGVRTLSPQDTLRLAAQAMEEMEIGSLPVCDGQRLLGMVTDRDLVVRGVAQGLAPERTTLSEVMSPHVQWCYEDQSIEEAAQLMCDAQIRRLPVVDHDKRLVGLLSLGDVAVKAGPGDAAQALRDISRPAQPERGGLSQASGPAGGGADAAGRRS